MCIKPLQRFIADMWRVFAECLFDRQMVLLDQLRQFMVKVYHSCFNYVDLRVVYMFVDIIIFYNQ